LGDPGILIQPERTPRLRPLIVFAILAFVLLRYVRIEISTPCLVALWLKKHDLYAVLASDARWDALLRTLGLRWTKPVDPSA
jgi:hypothetical protein